MPTSIHTFPVTDGQKRDVAAWWIEQERRRTKWCGGAGRLGSSMDAKTEHFDEQDLCMFARHIAALPCSTQSFNVSHRSRSFDLKRSGTQSSDVAFQGVMQSFDRFARFHEMCALFFECVIVFCLSNRTNPLPNDLFSFDVQFRCNPSQDSAIEVVNKRDREKRYLFESAEILCERHPFPFFKAVV